MGRVYSSSKVISRAGYKKTEYVQEQADSVTIQPDNISAEFWGNKQCLPFLYNESCGVWDLGIP